MILWYAIAALTLAVLLLLLAPLLRRQTAAPNRIGYDVAVYRDQLAELDRDMERGLVNAEQAAPARLEIQRRLLAAQAADEADTPSTDARALQTGRWLRLIAAMVILAGVPIGTLLVYGRLGAPELPAQPFAERANSPEFKMAAMVEKLADNLKRNPDAHGYVLLGNAQKTMRRYDDAVESYRQAIQLGGGDSELLSTMGETIVLANGGGVMPEARQAFLQALKADPRDPRASFYLGLAKLQIGKPAEAIAVWRALEQNSPADAPWLPMVKGRIEAAAKEAKLDPATIAPQAPSTEGVPDLPAAQSTPQDQQAMILSMVAGLAAKMEKNPGDMAGWLRLSQAYRVLGQLDKATDAAKRAVALDAKSVDALEALGNAQLAGAKNDTDLPDDFIVTMRKLLTLDAKNGEALYYVGAVEARDGHPAKARELWGQLLAQLPASSPDRTDLQKQIDALPKN